MTRIACGWLYRISTRSFWSQRLGKFQYLYVSHHVRSEHASIFSEFFKSSFTCSWKSYSQQECGKRVLALHTSEKFYATIITFHFNAIEIDEIFLCEVHINNFFVDYTGVIDTLTPKQFPVFSPLHPFILYQDERHTCNRFCSLMLSRIYLEYMVYLEQVKRRALMHDQLLQSGY